MTHMIMSNIWHICTVWWAYLFLVHIAILCEVGAALAVFLHINAKILVAFGHAEQKKYDLYLQCGRHICSLIYVTNTKI